MLIQAIKKTDETTTNLKCVIPSGLLPSYGKDYFTMSITSFYCYNTFYQMDNTPAVKEILEPTSGLSTSTSI